MTACVILYRVKGGPVAFVGKIGLDGILAEFSDRDAAIDYAVNNKLFDSGQADYQIVELDDL